LLNRSTLDRLDPRGSSLDHELIEPRIHDPLELVDYEYRSIIVGDTRLRWGKLYHDGSLTLLPLMLTTGWPWVRGYELEEFVEEFLGAEGDYTADGDGAAESWEQKGLATMG